MAMPPALLVESAEGFVDLTFSIADDLRTAGGGRRFEVVASHEGDLVGLSIELSAGWAARGTGEVSYYTGNVTYRSSGEASDRFASLLDRLYETGLFPTRMEDFVEFSAMTIGDAPSAIGSSLIYMKLFYGAEGTRGYAEVYTDIDLPQGLIRIREKDPHYRRPLVEALTGAEV